jgi:ubiquinone/menaquinone biosynthesis C-methylase UbiE
MENMAHNASSSETTRRRYNRLAPFYDLLETPMERLRFGAWRSRLRDRNIGPKALEIGVGTGKNMPYITLPV